MNLDFTPEQDMLREAVRGLCASKSPLEKVRELEDDPKGYDDEFWAQLGGLGLTGMMLPGEFGGSDMSMLDTVVVYEEFGRALAPSPHFVSSVCAGGAINLAGSDEQRSTWLPKIASGDSIMTIGWLEPDNSDSAKGVQLTAEATDGGFKLTGTKRHVTFASSAERIVILARTGSGETDIDLFLVDPSADGVTLTQQMSISSDTQYRVDLDGVSVTEADRIGAAGTGWDTWHKVMLDGIVLLAAQANGGASYSHEIATDYAKNRVQFDKPIGAFQALNHYLADGITEIAGSKLLTYEAAWASSVGRDTNKLAPMAKIFATETFRKVTGAAQQIFGGVGFTVEYDIQLFFRRAKQLQITWWDTAYLEELVAVQTLD